MAEENKRRSGLKRDINRYSSDFMNPLRQAICPQEGYRVHSVDSYVHSYRREHPDEKAPCTKTLYTYIDLNLLEVRNIDLPRKVTMRKRKPKPSEPRGSNKNKLGTSIDQRDPDVLSRQEFGHWELDLVLGGKTKDEPVIITLLERKTREYLTCKVWSKFADVITKYVWETLKPYVEKGAVKTLTTDNGAECSNLSSLEDQG